jgi:hypothetical protein
MKIATWTGLIMGLLIGPASADEVFMVRVLSCANVSAKMEIFVPRSVIDGRGVDNVNLAKPVEGLYSEDLSSVDKGKILGSIRLSITPDKKFVVIDQYTISLPPVQIPVAGGTVDFDKRFGTKAKCDRFNNG